MLPAIDRGMLRKGAVNSSVLLANSTGYTEGYTKDTKQRNTRAGRSWAERCRTGKNKGAWRDSDSNHCTIKYSQVSNFALKIGNRESDGNVKQNRTRGFMPQKVMWE